jgi:hypothetical protein
MTGEIVRWTVLCVWVVYVLKESETDEIQEKIHSELNKTPNINRILRYFKACQEPQ